MNGCLSFLHAAKKKNSAGIACLTGVVFLFCFVYYPSMFFLSVCLLPPFSPPLDFCPFCLPLCFSTFFFSSLSPLFSLTSPYPPPPLFPSHFSQLVHPLPSSILPAFFFPPCFPHSRPPLQSLSGNSPSDHRSQRRAHEHCTSFRLTQAARAPSESRSAATRESLARHVLAPPGIGRTQ